ncbi:MAG: hypothetical protein AB1899_18190 [Pseudomonadota bacterium]
MIESGCGDGAMVPGGNVAILDLGQGHFSGGLNQEGKMVKLTSQTFARPRA